MAQHRGFEEGFFGVGAETSGKKVSWAGAWTTEGVPSCCSACSSSAPRTGTAAAKISDKSSGLKP